MIRSIRLTSLKRTFILLVLAALASWVFPGAASATIPAGNLTKNPSFETNLSGWQESGNDVMSRVSGTSPPDGSWAVQVSSNTGVTSAYGIDDDGNTVESAEAGFVYKATASFKAPTAAMVGKQVNLVLREWTPSGSFVTSKTSSVTLASSSWVEATTTMIARTTGNRIDVQLVRPSGSIIAGDTFYADAISLVSSVIPSGNLLSNSTFEGSTTGWGASSNATLKAVTDTTSPYRGYAAQLSLSSGASAYSMSFNPAATKASWGTHYTAFAFVRAANAAANGKQVGLKVVEKTTGGSVVESEEKQITISSAEYRPVSLSYMPASTLDNLELQIVRPSSVASGEAIDVAAPSIESGFGSAPDQVPTDTGAAYSPWAFWGAVGCQTADRYSWQPTGGDSHLMGNGLSQGNESFRRLTVFDGDEVFGERCELGLNDHRFGPTAVYQQGDHRVTYFSVRLPSNFPLSVEKWQDVMQMKQAQPNHPTNEAVALEMGAFDNEWVISNQWKSVWSFPAEKGVWTRFRWDVHYSKNPEEGSLQVSADLNGDGDFTDPGEQSPTIKGATLATEEAGSFNTADGIGAGEAIPSHLRMGIYHDPSISCPAPSGCSVDIDNVEIE